LIEQTGNDPISGKHFLEEVEEGKWLGEGAADANW
jgi:hypothetical protein